MGHGRPFHPGDARWPTRSAPAPAGSTAVQDPNVPPAALVACADSLQRGDAVVAAAEASRDHWSSHVRAQTDYDGGAISRQQMLDTFAATKAVGPADLAAFDAAKAQYAPGSSGCAGLDPGSVGPRWQPMATQCSQRAVEQAAAVQAGDAVVADWRAHVEMMQNKPHTDPTSTAPCGGRWSTPRRRTWTASPRPGTRSTSSRPAS